MIIFLLFIVLAYFFTNVKNEGFKKLLNILTSLGMIISLGYYLNILGIFFINWDKLDINFAFMCFAIIIGLIISISNRKASLTLFISGILILSLLKNNNIYLFLSIVLAIPKEENAKSNVLPFAISVLYFLNSSLEFSVVDTRLFQAHYIQTSLALIFVVRNISQISFRSQKGLLMILVFLLDLAFVSKILMLKPIDTLSVISPFILCTGVLILLYKSVVQRSLLILCFYIICGSAFGVFDLKGTNWIALYLIIFPMIFSFIGNSNLKENFRVLLNYFMAISFVSAQLYLIQQVADYNSVLLVCLFIMCLYLQLRTGLENIRLVTDAQ